MKRLIRFLSLTSVTLLLILSAGMPLTLTGCNDDSTVEEKAEDAVDETEDAIEDAGDEIEDMTDNID